MSTNGFDAEDLSSTLARFSDKRRSIVYDESRLERKTGSVTVALPSATQNCGSNMVSGIASIFGGRRAKQSYTDLGKVRFNRQL